MAWRAFEIVDRGSDAGRGLGLARYETVGKNNQRRVVYWVLCLCVFVHMYVGTVVFKNIAHN